MTTMTTQSIGDLYSFILTVTGSEEALNDFSDICKNHKVKKEGNQLTVNIQETGRKIMLTGEVENRNQVLSRIIPAIENAITTTNVTVVSFC